MSVLLSRHIRKGGVSDSENEGSSSGDTHSAPLTLGNCRNYCELLFGSQHRPGDARAVICFNQSLKPDRLARDRGLSVARGTEVDLQLAVKPPATLEA